MKKKIIGIIIILFILFFFAVVYVTYLFSVRLSWFNLEDRVSHEYSEVVDAIEKFKSENNKYPENLIELKPTYISVLPEMPEIIKVNYEISSDKTTYRIKLRVKSKGLEREFVYSSDGKLTDDEKSRTYTGCHGWEVLETR